MSRFRTSHDVVVIGAGLHGLSCALQLSRAGLSVLVLEKDHAGRHASGVNAGGVRRLGRHDAEIPLSVSAMSFWHRIEDEIGDSCGFKACGQVKVAENEEEALALQSRTKRLHGLGYEHEEWIGAGELSEMVPALGSHCVGAIVCRGDGAANPFRTVMGFRRAALDAGAEILENAPALTLSEQGGSWCVRSTRGDHHSQFIVNCAGAWGGAVSRQLGESIPLASEAPMLMITERLQPFLEPVLGAAGRVLSFKQFDNGTLLIGGGYRGVADPDSNHAGVDFHGLSTSARTVQALFPQLQGVRVVRCWAGLEGVTPDGIPVVGPSTTAEGVFHAYGFSAHGFQLSPATGFIVAGLITSGHSPLPIEAFSPGRFTAPPNETLQPMACESSGS